MKIGSRLQQPSNHLRLLQIHTFTSKNAPHLQNFLKGPLKIDYKTILQSFIDRRSRNRVHSDFPLVLKLKDLALFFRIFKHFCYRENGVRRYSLLPFMRRETTKKRIFRFCDPLWPPPRVFEVVFGNRANNFFSEGNAHYHFGLYRTRA